MHLFYSVHQVWFVYLLDYCQMIHHYFYSANTLNFRWHLRCWKFPPHHTHSSPTELYSGSLPLVAFGVRSGRHHHLSVPCDCSSGKTTVKKFLKRFFSFYHQTYFVGCNIPTSTVRIHYQFNLYRSFLRTFHPTHVPLHLPISDAY